MTGPAPAHDERTTRHEDSNITAFATTAHIAFLNLHVTGWVLILTGIAGAILARTRLRRIPATKNRPGTTAASITS